MLPIFASFPILMFLKVVQVYQWRTDACRRMVSRDPRTEVHKILGIRFDWPDPQSWQISWRPDKKCAKYPLWRNFVPQKSRPKFTLGRLDTIFVSNR